MNDVTHLPTPGVILDLDIEQRDERDIKPPFIVTVGSKQVTFADPNEIDWRDLAAVKIPADILVAALSTEDLKHVRSQEMPAWKFNKLMDTYYDYYNLEEKIRDARRRDQFGS